MHLLMFLYLFNAWDGASMMSIRNKCDINDFMSKSQDVFCVLILKYNKEELLNLIMERKINYALKIVSVPLGIIEKIASGDY